MKHGEQVGRRADRAGNDKDHDGRRAAAAARDREDDDALLAHERLRDRPRVAEVDLADGRGAAAHNARQVQRAGGAAPQGELLQGGRGGRDGAHVHIPHR